MNGDGISDLVNIWPGNGWLTCAITLGSKEGLTDITQVFTTDLYYPGLDSIPPLIMDVNGDGASEIIYLFAQELENDDFVFAFLPLSYSAENDSLMVSDTITTSFYSADFYFQAADVNGDGRGDLVFFEADSATSSDLRYNIGFSDGNTFQFAENTQTLDAPFINPPEQLLFPANINGDPMSDFFYGGGTGGDESTLVLYHIVAMNDSSLQVQNVLNTSLSLVDKHLFTLDLNGDQLTDLVHTYVNSDGDIVVNPLIGTGEVLTNSGNSFTVSDASVTILPTDINGDNFTDLLITSEGDNGFVQLTPYISSGLNFESSTAVTLDSVSVNDLDIIPADINGDALFDLIVLNTTGTTSTPINALITPTVFPDLITEVDNGVGGNYQISYSPLTDSTVYSATDTNESQLPGIAFFNFSNGARIPAGSNPTVYQSGNSNGIISGSFPIQEVNMPIYVVDSYVQNSQVGDRYAYGLQYSDAKIDRSGRGWIGFAKKTLIDSTEQTYALSKYLQDFPGTGTVDTSTVYALSNNDKLMQKRFVYKDSLITTSKGYTVHQWNKATSRSDFYQEHDYAFTTGVNYQYDGYGNAIVIENLSDTTESNVVYTLQQFSNDTLNWRLGYLESTQKSAYADGKDTLNLAIYQYDDQMNILQKQVWDNAQATFVNNWYGYDDYGNQITHVSPSRDTTRFYFGSTFQTYNIQKVSPLLVNASGEEYQLTHIYDYDPRFGTLISYTNPNSQSWQFQLDDFGRDTLVMGPDPFNPNNPLVIIQQKKRGFDENGYMYLESDQLLSWDSSYYHVTQSKLDGLGRIFRKQIISTSKTISTDYHYDNKNRIIAKSLPYKNDSILYSNTTYDQKGRVIQKTFPFLNGDSVIHEISYNNHTKQKIIYRAVGSPVADTLTYYHDYFESQEKVIKIIDQLNGVTTHQRDLLGRDTVIIDPAQNKNKMSISTVNRSMNTYDLSFNQTNYLYIDSLRTKKVINQNSDTVHFQYDPLNRIASVRWSANDSINYQYDATDSLFGLGKASFITMNNGDQYRYTYDAYGAAKGIDLTIDGQSFYTQYEYSPTKELAKLIYPDGTSTSIAYTDEDYVSEVSYTADSTTTLATYTDHTVFGEPQNEKFGNGTSVLISFNEDSSLDSLLLQGLAVTTGQDTTLLHQVFSWDQLTRVNEITDLSEMNLTQKFGYDPKGRINTATGKYGNKTYQYDSLGAGNLILKDSILYSFENNQVTSGIAQSNVQDTVFSATYDTNGNRITTTTNQNNYQYTYNELDQLIGLSNNQIPTDSIDYNHKGVRYKKTDYLNNLTSYYINPYYTVTIDSKGNSIQTKYIPGEGIVAAVTDPLQGTFQSGASGIPTLGMLYFYKDHLNSTSITTNQEGQLSTALFYEPHGALYGMIGPDNFSTKFQDKAFDEEADLYYFDARFYDANTGSFLTADPVLSGMVDRYNRYAFVGNSPLNYIDPSGHHLSNSWWISGAIDVGEILMVGG